MKQGAGGSGNMANNNMSNNMANAISHQSDPSAPSRHTGPRQDSASNLEAYIQQEIQQRIQKRKNWSALEVCFRWQLVSAYLIEKNILQSLNQDHIQELRLLVRNNTLEGVKYSHSEMKLTYIDPCCIPGCPVPGPTTPQKG